MLVYTAAMCFAIGLLTGMGLAASLKLTFFFGIPTVFVAFGMEKLQKRMAKAPFWLMVLTQATAYTMLVTAGLFDIVAIMPDRKAMGSENPIHWVIFKVPWMYPLFFSIVLASISLTAIIRKLGPGVFWNWVRGYYYQPRKETRIFMFLDMKDSTVLAEQLGNEQFGALLRDFMYDLGEAVAATKGQVSHYIGDEAVLTWTPQSGFAEANCVQCFYRFQATLERRRTYYQDTYKVFPLFKAGLHFGEVIATEVGDVKSEIVYLGDVVNTAARIQSACNELGADFLISQGAAAQLPTQTWLKLEPLGEVELKGKSAPMLLVKASLT